MAIILTKEVPAHIGDFPLTAFDIMLIYIWWQRIWQVLFHPAAFLIYTRCVFVLHVMACVSIGT